MRKTVLSSLDSQLGHSWVLSVFLDTGEKGRYTRSYQASPEGI